MSTEERALHLDFLCSVQRVTRNRRHTSLPFGYGACTVPMYVTLTLRLKHIHFSKDELEHYLQLGSRPRYQKRLVAVCAPSASSDYKNHFPQRENFPRPSFHILLSLSQVLASNTAFRMRKPLHTLLVLLSYIFLATALPTSLEASITRRQSGDRLIAYVQNFQTPDNHTLRLLPLITENTGVTHVIISSFHIHAKPGNITLNDLPPNAAQYAQAWSDVKQLQVAGIKVMGLLGGAAPGTYNYLSGNKASV